MEAVTENALAQAYLASLIPTMDAQATLEFSSANMSLLLSRTTLGKLRSTDYSIQHNGMEAKVSIPRDTFKPIKLSLFLDAVTDGGISSIYSLPELADDAIMVLALIISNGNSSAPLHVDPVEAVPQVSSFMVHINATDELEPLLARNLTITIRLRRAHHLLQHKQDHHRPNRPRLRFS